MDPSFFLPCLHGPRALRLGHKRKEKTRSITCRMDSASKRYIFSSNFSSIHVQELHLHHRVFNRNFQDMSQGPLVSLSRSAKGT